MLSWAILSTFSSTGSAGCPQWGHCSPSRLQKVTLAMCSWSVATSTSRATRSTSTALKRRQSMPARRGWKWKQGTWVGLVNPGTVPSIPTVPYTGWKCLWKRAGREKGCVKVGHAAALQLYWMPYHGGEQVSVHNTWEQAQNLLLLFLSAAAIYCFCQALKKEKRKKKIFQFIYHLLLVKESFLKPSHCHSLK